MDNTATLTPEAGSSSDTGPSRQAQADAANRATLEKTYDAIEAREKAVERQPVIADGFRARAVAERLIEEDSDYTAQGLPVFRPNGAVPSISDSLSAAYDRAAAKEARAEAKRMPPLKDGSSVREQLEASARWMDLPDQTKRQFKAGHTEAKAQAAAAEWFGVDLATAKAIEIEARLAAQDRVRPLHERVAKLAPGHDPNQVLDGYTAWAEALARDPKGAYRQLGKQLGLGPTPEQVQQFQQRARAARETAVLKGRAVHAIDSFTQRCPDFGQLEDGMLRALQSGRIVRTGDPARDLHAAYRAAGGRYA